MAVGLCLALLLGWATYSFANLVQRLLLHISFAWDGTPFKAKQSRDDEHTGDYRIDERQYDIRTHAATSYWSSTITTFSAVVLIVSLSIAGRFALHPGANYGLVKTPQSGKCGLFVLDHNASNPVQDEQLFQYLADKERRAADYAKLCYRGSNAAGLKSCSLFVQKKIDYTTFGSSCPFADGLCQDGASGAITFDTGLQPVRNIGSNIAKTPYFRHTMTCAPVTANREYIDEIPPEGDIVDYRFRYKYGDITHKTKGKGNATQAYTFEMPGDPFRWAVGTYSAW